MRHTLLAILLASMAHAQAAPTNVVQVGVSLRTQTGGPGGQQRMRVVAEPGHTMPEMGLGIRPRIGGQVWLFAAALTNLQGVNPWTFQPTGEVVATFYSLVWTSSISHHLPYAAPGHSYVFGTPTTLYPASITHEWFGPAPWDDQTIASPPTSWQSSFLLVNIPSNQSLLGLPVSVQSYRVQPDWQLFVSDEIIFAIG